MSVSYTLLADGPSDSILHGPIDWLLKKLGVDDFNGQFADPKALPKASAGLEARMPAAAKEYPCDILFVHRDAENQTIDKRRKEIEAGKIMLNSTQQVICVVPVRMSESWFLFDEQAIRGAAGNPNGTQNIMLPTRNEWETVHAKQRLNDSLIRATGLTGRRLDRARRNLHIMKVRVRDYVMDYTPLMNLPSFRAFHDDLRQALVP